MAQVLTEIEKQIQRIEEKSKVNERNPFLEKSNVYTFNLDVYIPLSTLRARIGDTSIKFQPGSIEGETVQLSQITVTVGDISQVEEAADIIRILLEKSHDPKAPDYSITVPKELSEDARAALRAHLPKG